MSEAKRVVTREENPVAYNCGCRYMGDEGRCFGCVAAIREAGIAEGRRMEREAIVAWLRDDETSNAIWLDHRQAEALAKLVDAGAHRGEHERGSGE